MRVFVITLLLVGCASNNELSVDVPDKDRMVCLSVGDTKHSRIFKCENKEVICYSQSRAISCITKGE